MNLLAFVAANSLFSIHTSEIVSSFKGDDIKDEAKVQ